MGCWSVYCGLSNISITEGHKCVLLPLKTFLIFFDINKSYIIKNNINYL